MKKLFYSLLSISLLVVALYVFQERVLVAFASYLEVYNGRKNADAMIVLAGNPYTRPHAAAEFYKEGYAKKIYLTRTKSIAIKEYDFMLSQDEIARRVFAANGIVDIGVIPSTKGGATSTLDEARDAALYFRDKGIGRVVIVTDAFHTRRALRAFDKMFALYNLPIKVEALAAKNGLYDKSNWWRVEAGLVAYVLEGIKSVVYYFIDENLQSIEES